VTVDNKLVEKNSIYEECYPRKFVNYNIKKMKARRKWFLLLGILVGIIALALWIN